jgi:hypothetical protein
MHTWRDWPRWKFLAKWVAALAVPDSGAIRRLFIGGTETPAE